MNGEQVEQQQGRGIHMFFFLIFFCVGYCHTASATISYLFECLLYDCWKKIYFLKSCSISVAHLCIYRVVFCMTGWQCNDVLEGLRFYPDGDSCATFCNNTEAASCSFYLYDFYADNNKKKLKIFISYILPSTFSLHYQFYFQYGQMLD